MKLNFPTMSPKLKYTLGSIIGVVINGLHIMESLSEAIQAPLPDWIIKLMRLWFAGTDPTSGGSLIIGLYGVIGFITGVVTFYWHHKFVAMILSYTIYHLLKLRKEYREYIRHTTLSDNEPMESHMPNQKQENI